MRSLHRRIEALERRIPTPTDLFEAQMFDYWVRYGDAYGRAIVRNEDTKEALAELHRQLSPYWVEQVVGFCEASLDDCKRRQIHSTIGKSLGGKCFL